MKYSSFIILSFFLCIAALFAGCSSGSDTNTAAQVTVTATPAPANITYENHGLGFVYPNSFSLTEHDSATGINAAPFESGEVHLRAKNGDNLTVMWMAMQHRPPDIPKVYESMRSGFQNDPRLSDVKFFLLQTYPATTCNDTTFIGHVSYFDKVRSIPTNEAIIFWYHPKQDRTYIIDTASGKDYETYLKGSLGSFQQSFRCMDA